MFVMSIDLKKVFDLIVLHRKSLRNAERSIGQMLAKAVREIETVRTAALEEKPITTKIEVCIPLQI